MNQSLPRLLPELPLPPYTYVPGRFPHPVSDPAGHSHGATADMPTVASLADPGACLPYLHGIDLFNHGYYWEAHESWEGLWRIAPEADESGRLTAFFKGLIKLAAAAVKLREGNAVGARRHAGRAQQLLRESGGPSAVVFDMALGSPFRLAEQIERDATAMCEHASDWIEPQPLLPPMRLMRG